MLVLGSLATGGLIAPPIARWRPTKRQLDAQWREQTPRQEFFEQRQVFFEQAWSLEKALMQPKGPEKLAVEPGSADVKSNSAAADALSAFTSWGEEQELQKKREAFLTERQAFFEEAWAHSTARLQSAVNQLTSPDVPLRLLFEGIALPTTLRGNASTSELPVMATRLHNLEPKQQLRFVLNGTTPLRLGVPVAESPLANTRNLEVLILPAHSCAIRRSGFVTEGGVTTGTTWWGGAGTGSGQRGSAALRKSNAKIKQDLVQKQVLKQLAESSGDTPEAQIVLMQHEVNKLAKKQLEAEARKAEEEQRSQAQMQLEVNRMACAAEAKREADAKRLQALMQQQVNQLAAPGFRGGEPLRSAAGAARAKQPPSPRRVSHPATGANAQQPAQQPAAHKSATARSAARKAKPARAVNKVDSSHFAACGFEWAQKPTAAERETARKAKPMVREPPPKVKPQVKAVRKVGEQAPKPSVGFDWATGAVQDP